MFRRYNDLLINNKVTFFKQFRLNFAYAAEILTSEAFPTTCLIFAHHTADSKGALPEDFSSLLSSLWIISDSPFDCLAHGTKLIVRENVLGRLQSW